MTTTPGISAQQLVEHALATSTADDCVAIVRDVTSANLRWANNTLTTNGAMSGRSVSVISVVGESVGVRSATSADDLAALREGGLLESAEDQTLTRFTADPVAWSVANGGVGA